MAKINSYNNLAIVELAMHSSIFIYVFVLFFMAKSNPSEAWSQGWVLKPENQILFYVLVGLSLASTVLVVIVPSLVPKKKIDEAELTTPERDGWFLDYKNPDERVNKITVMRMAFAESIAIFGFVLAFLNHAPWLILPFAVFALALQVIFGPILGKIMSSS